MRVSDSESIVEAGWRSVRLRVHRRGGLEECLTPSPSSRRAERSRPDSFTCRSRDSFSPRVWCMRRRWVSDSESIVEAG